MLLLAAASVRHVTGLIGDLHGIAAAAAAVAEYLFIARGDGRGQTPNRTLSGLHDARARALSLLASGVTRPSSSSSSSSSCYVDVTVRPPTKRNAHSSSSNWVHPLRQQTECEQLCPPLLSPR